MGRAGTQFQVRRQGVGELLAGKRAEASMEPELGDGYSAISVEAA
jgi:hypothetical protein